MSEQAGRAGGGSGGGRESGAAGPDAELADEVASHLQSLGCFVEPSWFQTWLTQHRSSTGMGAERGAGAAGGQQAQELARLCLAHVLQADLRTVGAPALPPQVSALHGTTLPGQLLLQVCRRCADGMLIVLTARATAIATVTVPVPVTVTVTVTVSVTATSSFPLLAILHCTCRWRRCQTSVYL